jgi:polyisoprenoid-binding protein YceI
MFKSLIVLLSFPFILLGANLTLNQGKIQASTEVFGDASINPSVTKINTDLSLTKGDPQSLTGDISFNIIDFTSTESARDEHMQEMFEMKKNPSILLHIDEALPQQMPDTYILKGTLKMHGVSKQIQTTAKIEQKNNHLFINSNFHVKVSDYGMEPPSLLFFTVRDRVDINASLDLTVQN